MKIETLVLAGCLVAGTAAAEAPPALQPVAAFAGVVRLDDLIQGTSSYRVDFCTDGDCDMFLADSGHMRELSDYSMLFASTDLDYVAKLTTPLDTKAIASILDRDAKKYGCKADGKETICVMHALYLGGKLKRYSFLTKDADVYEEVDEEGNYIPGGYD